MHAQAVSAERCDAGQGFPPPPRWPRRPTIDRLLERRLRLRPLQLEGGGHHAVLYGERLGVQVDGGHLAGETHREEGGHEGGSAGTP
jgi:hypothetical protein